MPMGRERRFGVIDKDRSKWGHREPVKDAGEIVRGVLEEEEGRLRKPQYSHLRIFGHVRDRRDRDTEVTRRTPEI